MNELALGRPETGLPVDRTSGSAHSEESANPGESANPSNRAEYLTEQEVRRGIGITKGVERLEHGAGIAARID